MAEEDKVRRARELREQSQLLQCAALVLRDWSREACFESDVLRRAAVARRMRGRPDEGDPSR
jgi:hypothetical protein